MFNKRTGLARLFFSIAIVLVSCGSLFAENHASPALIPVKAAVPESFPPQYQIDSTGHPQGFAIDVMNSLARRAGLTVSYSVKQSWTEVAEALRQGEVDIIPNLGISEQRREYALFTKPVETFPISVLVRLDNPAISSLSDLGGRDIGVIEFNIAVRLVEQLGVSTPVRYKTIDEALFALLSGAIDAVAYPEPVARMVARRYGIENRVKVVYPHLMEVKRAVAVSPKSPHLVAVLDRAIEELVGSAEYQTIYTKWYGTPKPFWSNQRIVLATVFGVVLLVAWLSAWRYSSVSAINQRLRDATIRLRTLVDERPEAIFVHQDDRFIYLNSAAISMLAGKSIYDFSNRPLLDFVHPDHHDYVRERISDALDKGSPATPGKVKMVALDGTTISVQTSTNSIPWDGGVAVQVVAHDVTEAERTQEIVREHEEYFRATFEQAAVGMAHIAFSGEYMLVNDRFCQIVRRSRDELIGMRFQDITHPDHAENDLIAQNAMSAGKLSSYKTEKRYLGPNGETIWVRISATIVRTLTEASDYYLAVVEDITDRKVSEERERRLLDIIEATPDIVGIFDQDGKILFLNLSGRLKLGFGLDENLEGVSMADIVSANDYELMLSDGLPSAGERGSWHNETIFLHRDGTDIPTSQIILSHRKEDGVIAFYSSIARDISDMRDMERRLFFAQKMEAIGQLTGGVAHDFNNLLQVIQSNAELIKYLDPDDAKKPVFIEQVLEACARGAKLTQQLLAFSRKQQVNAEMIDVASVVNDMLVILDRTLGESIRIDVNLEKGLPRVSMDPHIFENALLNLTLNSKFAMPKGGSLSINVRRKTVDKKIVRMSTELQPGDYVSVSVVDTGVGMSDEIMNRVFEPFFTTKAIGEGSGLGLSMVYGFVEQSGGAISIASEEGQGTEITLWFPIPDSSLLSNETPAVKPENAIPSQTGRVLFVEDDENVRLSTHAMLVRMGYEVVQAADGDAAAVILQHDTEFQLLFTDIVMPGRINGLQLARVALLQNPDIKVLLTTGYPAADIGDVVDSGFKVLHKPFTSEDLGFAIQGIFDPE